MGLRSRFKQWRAKRKAAVAAEEKKPQTGRRFRRMVGLSALGTAASVAGSIGLMRSALGPKHEKVPLHLRPDVHRAKKLGLHAVAHKGSEIAAFAMPLTKTARAGTNSTPRAKRTGFTRIRIGMPLVASRRSNVTVMRHEIGHLEERVKSQRRHGKPISRDMERIKRAGQEGFKRGRLVGHLQKQVRKRLQDEVQAWKNAIRATPAGGHLHRQSMKAALGTYYSAAQRVGIGAHERDKAFKTLDRYERFTQHLKRKAQAQKHQARRAARRKGKAA